MASLWHSFLVFGFLVTSQYASATSDSDDWTAFTTTNVDDSIDDTSFNTSTTETVCSIDLDESDDDSSEDSVDDDDTCTYIVEMIFDIPYSFTNHTAINETAFAVIIHLTIDSILSPYTASSS